MKMNKKKSGVRAGEGEGQIGGDGSEVGVGVVWGFGGC